MKKKLLFYIEANTINNLTVAVYFLWNSAARRCQK
jgi:hypothetical protein